MRRLSIGAKWTLRYAAAMLVAVTVFAFYTYWRIDQKFEREARLVLNLQLQEIAHALEAGTEGDALRELVVRSTVVAGPDLKLGLQLYGPDGALRISEGSLAKYDVGLPAELPDDSTTRIVRSFDAPGEKYPYLVITRRLQGGSVLQGAVYLRRFVRNARSVRDIYLWALPLALAVTLGLGSWLVRGSLRPIAAMARAAQRISGTHLEESIPTTGSGDELDELASTLNAMMERIRAGVERMQRFSANAAHELRTPLAALRSRLEVTLEQERSPDEYRKILAETGEQVAALSDAVHAMLRLAQSEAGLPPEHRVAVAIAPLLREVAEFFLPLAAEQGLALEVSRIDEATVAGEPAWLHQCFANLLDNAIRYTPEGGRVGVEAERSADGREVAVRVRDTGPGIEPEERERIFEPYHRVRGGSARTGPGAGLGLPLAREIARAHGGDVAVESEPGRGSVFSVRLPVAPPA